MGHVQCEGRWKKCWLEPSTLCFMRYLPCCPQVDMHRLRQDLLQLLDDPTDRAGPEQGASARDQQQEQQPGQGTQGGNGTQQLAGAWVRAILSSRATPQVFYRKAA